MCGAGSDELLQSWVFWEKVRSGITQSSQLWQAANIPFCGISVPGFYY